MNGPIDNLTLTPDELLNIARVLLAHHKLEKKHTQNEIELAALRVERRCAINTLRSLMQPVGINLLNYEEVSMEEAIIALHNLWATSNTRVRELVNENLKLRGRLEKTKKRAKSKGKAA